MRSMRWILVVGCLLHPASLSGLRADGGTLRVSARAGVYRISVFTSPTPFRAGPVDVSVLVQDGRTGEPLPQVNVTVRAAQRNQISPIVQQATREAATNKLFHAAALALPEPGWWEIEIAVEGERGSERIQFALEATEAPPAFQELWPWLGWPALVIGLFCIHRGLVYRRARQAPV